MSKIKLTGNATGTGVFTLESPATSTDRVITLPDETTTLTGAPVGLDDVSGVARATSGLLFNGDTAAANALDDYEEGTFTPGFIGSTSAGSYTSSTPLGSYTKIGNLVHIRLSMWNITTSSAGSGNIRITGLPYTVSNYDGRGSIGTLELDSFTFSGSLSATAEQNTTFIELRQSRTNAGDYIMQVGDKPNNNADLIINITYRT